MRITGTKTNHIVKPMGYLMDKPVFSYKVEDAVGKKQTEGHILVAKDPGMSEIVYDSGVRTDMDNIAFPVDMRLAPCTRYYWTVEVVTDAGERAISDVSWFETGKRDQLWEGKWICSELNGSHPVFFTDISMKGQVKRARLYICGLGLYEAYINGEMVCEEYLTPYCNDYTQWLQYQTYDVTKLLSTGKNTVEVLLGNGWYKGRFGLDDDGTTERLYGDTFGLIAELQVEYGDGSSEVFGTDESWKVKKSQILESSFYNGEVCDATVKEDEGYPVKIWEHTLGALTERLSLPIRVKEVLMPVRVLHTPKDELVLDLGQNHSGWFELKIREEKGRTVKLYFGEELQDGSFFNGNLRTGKSEYTYTADGTDTVIRPHFTSFGYRYVKLENFEHFTEGDYKGLVLYSDIEETGWIKTGNPLVDRLAKNAMWGQKSNFLDIPMDCPQRDERMGWTGDAQVFTPTACYNMDSYAFYRKFLHDMYEEQKHREGAVPFTIPACGQNSSCGIWGDAVTIIPFAVYQFYGDKEILGKQYDSMKAWISYIDKVNGDNWKWRKVFAFGDWLALDSRNEKMPTGGTDTGYLVTLYYYNSVKIVAETAAILGKEDEAKYYQDMAAELLSEIHEEYFSPRGRLCSDTQTGYLTALRFGVTMDKERTKEELRQSFRRNDDNLETGFVGTSMMCNVLSENGMDELAYSLLLNENYPGWLYSVKKGATTIWERWDSIDDSGHFSQSGLNSLNHYSYGTIVEWLFRHVAGIAPRLEQPGFRVVDLEPKVDYRLGKMDAYFDSPIGMYRSKWEVTKSFGLHLEIEVPFGGMAYLALPYAREDIYAGSDNAIFKNVIETERGKRCVLEHGVYSITYDTIVPMRKMYSVESTIYELMANESTKAFVMKVLPMITALPESLYGSTLKELIARGSSVTPEQIEQINGMLRTL